MSAVRVLVCDDQAMIRAGLTTIIDAQDDLEVVGECGDGAAAVDLVHELHPDVVVMDIRMPRMDGIAATRAIVADPSLASVRVVVLTTFDEDENVLAAIRAGSAGYLLKDIAPADLRSALRTVAAGDALLSAAITRKVMSTLAQRPATSTRPALLESLTDREREVLTLIAQGLSNGEIAAQLVLSEATVKTHVGRILAKLGLRDRVQAVVLAYETGLVRAGGAP